MRRRTFIRTVARAVASSVAVSVAGGRVLPTLTTSVRVPTLDEIDENYFAFRERLKQIAKRGYEIERCELAPEENGFRFVTVYVKGEPPLTWFQPWNEDAHRKENLHRNFTPCIDCGARTWQSHHPLCPYATSLAYRRYVGWA